MINSYKTAYDYWEEKYGIAYDSDDFMAIQKELDEFRQEQILLTKKIQSNSEMKINNYNINRSIELYFLIKSADNYMVNCIEFAEFYNEIS